MSDGDAAAAETAETTTETTTETTPVAEQASDLSAEVEKWKALSKKHEDRAKANSKAANELQELRKQSMTDQEKAVAEAREAARADAFREFGSKLVDAEVRAAAKGRVGDVDALLEGLDRSKFVNDDGDADVDAISKWIDRLAPAQDDGDEPSPFPDIGQGMRTEGLQSQALGSDGLTQALKNIVGAR